MRRILYFVACLLLAAACQGKPQEAGFIVQVSLGGWHSPDYTAEQVISRIGEVSAKIPVEKVIIGWSLDQDIYRQVGEYLHANGIKMLLWLPVFAETEEMCENEAAVDLMGAIPANYDLAAGEGFRFNCPSRPETAANVVAIYDNHFKDCGFDGVFLDRIRTQSFVSGVSGVLTCGCPVCAELFKAEGVDLGEALVSALTVDDFSFVRAHDDVKEAFDAQEKKNAPAASSRRSRRSRRGEPEDGEEKKVESPREAAIRQGVVTDPALATPLSVTLKLTVRDFGTLASGEHDDEEEKQ